MTIGIATLSPGWLWPFDKLRARRHGKPEPARVFGAAFPRPIPPAFGPGLAVAAPSGVDWSTWFDHCWVAKGAASLEAAYVDLVGDADLTAGTAPGLSADGLTFNGSDQYLLTGVIPSVQNWSAFIRYSGLSGGVETLFGAYSDAIKLLLQLNSTLMRVFNCIDDVNLVDNSPALGSGVYGFAGLTPYRDGVAESNLISSVGDSAGDIEIYIGALNYNGSPIQHAPMTVQAFGIKAATLNETQVAAACAAMAAL
jgi:hypothetical protein